jgi:hypothetical protein
MNSSNVNIPKKIENNYVKNELNDNDNEINFKHKR